MKKVLVALAISCSTFMLSNVVIAAPHFNDESRMDSRRGHDKKKAREFREEEQQDNRRMREERGAKRLQQLRWQLGYVMPQQYRGYGYNVEYQAHSLPIPDRKPLWYIDN